MVDLVAANAEGEHGVEEILCEDLAEPGDGGLAGDIPDPFGGSLTVYRELVNRLEQLVEIASDRIIKHLCGEE